MFGEIVELIKSNFKPQPLTHDVDGRHYAVTPDAHGLKLAGQIMPPALPTLELKSLSGFRDAYLAHLDNFPKQETAVQVVDHLTVALVSLRADEFGRRHEYLRATCVEKNSFPFETYQMPEDFLLSLEKGFLPTDNVIQLQRMASSLSNKSEISTQDDGLSQRITVQQGGVSHAGIDLPRRIPLLAYRTFREVDPVSSDFMVRLQGEPGRLPKVALLQVDADRWKHDTALMVKNWLASELPPLTVVIA